MMSNNKIQLKDLFKGLQDQMLAQLSTNREFIIHPGTKGDSLENTWIEWLKKYLPNRYCIDKAIVIDSNGDLSHQIDIVIYDQHFTPFVFTQNGINYIPAEGVYAVFEVKPTLNKDYILYAGKKIESVRKLMRTSAAIIDRGVPRPPRSLTKIIGGILASDADIREDTVKDHLETLTKLQSLDLGCAVSFGTFYKEYDYKNPDKKFDDVNAEILHYYEHRISERWVMSESSKSLVTFFLQLLKYLQLLGTVPAIDLNAYTKSINFEIDEEI